MSAPGRGGALLLLRRAAPVALGRPCPCLLLFVFGLVPLLLSAAPAARAAAADRLVLAFAQPVSLTAQAVTLPDGPGLDGPTAVLARLRRGPGTAADAADAAPADGSAGATALWFVLPVVNESDTARWTLMVHQALLAHLEVWTVAADGTVTRRGDLGLTHGTPMAAPETAVGYDVAIPLPAGAPVTVVVRIAPILFLSTDLVLAPEADAAVTAALRRIIFPFLLGLFVGIAVLHGMVFVRFGEVSNLLFVGVALSLLADWLTWLGAPHDLGLAWSPETTLAASAAGWLSGTVFILVSWLTFLAPPREAPRLHAAAAVLLAVLVAGDLSLIDEGTALLRLIVGYLICSAMLVTLAGWQALRRRRAGAVPALLAFALGVSVDLAAYLPSALPGLEAINAWIVRVFGHFDIATLAFQVVIIGLFSFALWTRVRDRVAAREVALRAERLRSVRVAQLCHDIRSPLHALLSVIGAASARQPGGGGGAETRDLAAAQSAVRAMSGVLDALVEAARGEPRRGPGREALDPRALLADAAAIAHAELGDRPVQVETVAAPALPDRVEGDALALRRILGNLVANAVAATARGTIRLRADWLEGADAPQLALSVEDTGCGLSRERCAALFGPGGPAPGAGFGLRVVRRLLAAQRGTLDADSRPGAGTRVRVMLPAAAAPSAPVREAETGAPGLRLLLVEDDDLTAAAMATGLRAEGHEVVAAAGVEAALSAAGGRLFDCALVDLELGGGSGVDLIRRLRRFDDPVAAAVPVILMSGDRAAAESARESLIGVRAVLIKPFDGAALREALAALVCGGTPPEAGRETPSHGFLAELAAMVPPAGLRDLLATARERIADGHHAVSDAMAAADLEAAARAAHRLASAAAMVGQNAMVEAARHAEAAARDGDAAALEAAGRDVSMLLGGVLADLERWAARVADVPSRR